MRLVQLARGFIPLFLLGACIGATNEPERVASVREQPAIPDGAKHPPHVDVGVSSTNSWFSWWPKNLIVAPIPSREPVFGWGLQMMAGLFLDLDKDHPDTPPSSIGFIGWVTENGSYAYGGGGTFNLLDDHVRVDAAAMYIDMNYKFYGVGSEAGNAGVFVDVSQEFPVVYGNAKYQIFRDGFLGLGYLGGRADTTFKIDDPTLPPELRRANEITRMAGLETPFQYDTRDDQQYPRNGWLVDANAIFYTTALNGDFNAETVSVAANRYLTIRERDVLALRAFTSVTSDGAPFYLLSSVGGRQDMRGYAYGRYMDNVAYTLQSEYRWQPFDSWVLTGFAGVGEVAPHHGALLNDVLPAAGVGVRYVLSKEFKVNLALDIAVGRNGAEYYFTLGEAF